MNATEESIAKLDRESKLQIELLNSQVTQFQIENERLTAELER